MRSLHPKRGLKLQPRFATRLSATVATFFSLTFIFIKLDARGNVVASSASQPDVWSYLPAKELGGVHYHAVPGDFPTNNDSSTPGVMHVFIKCIRRKHRHLRGFVVFEPTARGAPKSGPARYATSHYAGNHAVHASLGMRLIQRETGTHRAIPFLQTVRARPTPPQFLVDAFFYDSNAYSLTFHGVPRVIHLDACLQESKPSTSEAPSTVAAVLIPWTRSDALEAQPLLLSTFLSHHLPKLVDRVLLFVRSSQQAAYNTNLTWLAPVWPQLVAGALSLVEWDVLALPMSAPPRLHGDPYFDQAVIYNFAVLSFWGTSTKVLLTDLDEFVVRHDGGSLASAFSHGCLSANNGCVHLQRRTMIPGPPPARISADFDDAAWEVLKAKYSLDGVGNAVRQLADVSCHTEKVGKMLVDPNRTFIAQVHDALTCRDGLTIPCQSAQACTMAQEACACILHNRNMMTMREYVSDCSLLAAIASSAL